MFEAVQDKKEASTSRLWISIVVIVVLVVVGAVMYTMSKSTAKGPASGAAAVAAPTNADAVKDLKIVRATMGKDRDGMTAVWSVTLEDRSDTYTYSGIRYEASYIGADNNAVLVNQGTISMTIGPGEQRSSEIRDALYPAATAWYKFRITGATPAVR
jgi:uncharacterized protein YpmB